MLRLSRIVGLLIGMSFVVLGFSFSVRGDVTLPTWTPGDYWAYEISSSGGPVTFTATTRLDVIATETVTIGGVPYASYRLALDQRAVYPPPFGAWFNATGVLWHRTSDLAPIIQYTNGTFEAPPTTFRIWVSAAFDPPQSIQWPLMQGNTWTWSGWVNSSFRSDFSPPAWSNTTATVSFVVEADRSVTVPAGTFTATPVRATSGGYANVTSYSPTVGNAVLVESSDPMGNRLQMELTSFRYQGGGGANEPPSVTVTEPSGGELFAGGSVHDIAYATADADDATLDVTIETSTDGGGTWSLPDFIPGQSTGAHTRSWTAPAVETTMARIRVCVSDSVNPAVCAATPDFAIDATLPAVVGSVPIDGASGVSITQPVTITFSEAMAPAATQAAISFSPVADPLSFSWNGNTLSVTHAAFSVDTDYTLNVDTDARDLSGNALSSPYAATFRTTAVVADPGGPYVGTVGEAIALDGSDSMGLITNYTWVIAPPAGSQFSVYGVQSSFVPSVPGTYQIALRVRDASGNTDEASTTATVSARDTTPPVITHTAHAPVFTGVEIVIEARVSDTESDVTEVRLVYTPVGGTEQNVSMTSRVVSGETVWSYTIPGQANAGTVQYRIYAVDAEGNDAITSAYTVTVRTPTAAPPLDLTPIILLVVLLFVVLLGVVYRWRRGKKAEPPASPPAPPSP